MGAPEIMGSFSHIKLGGMKPLEMCVLGLYGKESGYAGFGFGFTMGLLWSCISTKFFMSFFSASITNGNMIITSFIGGLFSLERCVFGGLFAFQYCLLMEAGPME